MKKCSLKTSGLGLCIMIGLMVLGNCVGNGMKRFADKDRYVTVKGLAEREVMANKVVWPLPFNCVGNNLEELYNEVEKSKRTILSFLESNGITSDEIVLSAPKVTDREAQSYTPDNLKYRYQTQFDFTLLNELKPEMIEEATRNARAVAQKFADDSKSELGGIRQASQGQFSITSDQNTPQLKKIRVVTTVDYFLK